MFINFKEPYCKFLVEARNYFFCLFLFRRISDALKLQIIESFLYKDKIKKWI